MGKKIQGCTKRPFLGCVKLIEEVAFCLPIAGRRTQFFHPIFTEPGKSLIVQPCSTRTRTLGRSRPYRRIEEKTGRFAPASMEVAILSIFTGSDEEPATMERCNQQLPRPGSAAHCICFLSFGSRFHPISTSAISQTAHANSRNPLIALPTAQDRQFSRGWLVYASIRSLCLGLMWSIKCVCFQSSCTLHSMH